MNLPLCRKENRKNEPKTAQNGGFLCKMTKKSQKIRHFDRAPTFVSAGISAFWHFSTKNEEKFVQNYLLTNSRKYGIIVSESEGTTMTYQEQINLLEALKLHYELFNLEYAESEEDKEMEIDFRKKCLKKLLKALDK